jgi:Xaa-Pro aminopeptidase
MTEKEIADSLDFEMRGFGAAKAGFDPIIAVDERASLCHAKAGEKKVTAECSVLIDWGAQFNQYNSDLTRVVFLGRIPRKLAKLYNVVLEAQREAIDAVRPGAEVAAVDIAARRSITKAGYGREFGHAVGHGIGRTPHEVFGVNSKNHNRLEPGMVFTVEPGIYIPGYGGIRIEDMVLVTETGHEVLTVQVPKGLESAAIGV